MKRALGVSLIAIMMLVGGVTPAEAGTFTTTAKWRNCDDDKAAISIRATFSNPAAIYGTGRFMIKKWVVWDTAKAGGTWRERDRNYTETNWVQINNTDYDFISTAADKTNWGALYDQLWRAHVTIKLVKNRPGPRDKLVDEIDLTPRKNSFPEQGTFCGVGGT
jgi:hypothetical protein